jgi:hypothetical protein
MAKFERVIWMLAAVPLAACSSSSSGSNGAGVTQNDASLTEAAAPDAASGLSLKWQVAILSPAAGLGDAGAATAPDGGVQSLPGVQVCVYNMPSIPCATTGADGVFTLTGLPVMSDIALTLNKDGYYPVIKPIETAHADMDGTPSYMYMGLTTAPQPPLGGTTVDWTSKGQVAFFAVGPHFGNPDAGAQGDPGATVSLTPAGGNGPFFLTDGNTFDLTAKTFVDVQGWYYNLDPGQYSLVLGDTNNDCEPISFPFGQYGYPGATHEVKFPIVAGYTTELVGELCTANSVIAPLDGSAPLEAGSGDAGATDASTDAGATDASTDAGSADAGDGG